MMRFAVVSAMLVMAACAPVPEPDAPSATESRMSLPEALKPFVDQAAADLAARMDVPVARIKTLEAEYVTWGDGALGCPEPGMMYTQALVPGYLIVLGLHDREYRYHGARGRAPAYCPAERAGVPVEERDKRS